jgi:hypothetical protein
MQIALNLMEGFFELYILLPVHPEAIVDFQTFIVDGKKSHFL